MPMSRADSRFEETTTAIDELLRISPVADPATVAREARGAKHRALKAAGVKAQVDCMLSAEATKALFSALPAGQFVSREVVAAYCDCSVLTLERRLKSKHNRLKDGELQGWKTALADPPPQCDARGYLRWSFVLKFAKAWDAERRAAKRLPARPRTNAARLKAVLQQQFRFLQHKNGAIEGAWGQGGVSVGKLLAILEAKGQLIALTPVEALSLPWANPTTRAPWDRAVSAVLADMTQAMEHGRAKGSASGIDQVMGHTRPAPRRRGL
jgi:hypothetical protein